MARIGGVNIPNHQHAELALTAIFGIGRSRSRAICEAAGINRVTKIKDLSDTDMDRLREQVAKIPAKAICARNIRTSSGCSILAVARQAPSPRLRCGGAHAHQRAHPQGREIGIRS